ncbi:hypothetical protein [Gordonia sp. NPDC003585]|uniref:hypothetical protein n=1 Tax=Gordonia sp. NPDC003585 TaxID=3154275 RepID=UPI00339F484F
MEYTELADYPTPSGIITEWIPSTRASDWTSDDRPLSTNHAAHLRHTRDDDVSWIGTAFAIDQPLEPRAFAATLRTWIARHEVFRSTVATDAAETARRHLEPEAIAIDVRRYGRVRDSLEVYRHLEEFLATGVRAHSWPHIVFTTVEHVCSGPEQVDGDRFTVIFGADHAVMDAYTQLLAIAEIREIYRAHLVGETPALPPCGSYVDHSVDEYKAATALGTDHPAVRDWELFLRSAPTSPPTVGEDTDPTPNTPALPGFPLPLGSEPAIGHAQAAQSSVSLWILPRESADAFSAACKAAGGSGSTGVLTAVAVALARLSGTRVTRYVMPMHTRTAPEWFTAAGWFVGLMPVADDLTSVARFSEALAGTATATRAHRRLVGHSFARIAELLQISPRARFVVSYVDGRSLPGASDWTPADRALRSPVHSDDEVYLWINRTADGINLAARFPGNDTAAASVHAFIAEFSSVLREVAADGDTEIVLDAHVGSHQQIAALADRGESR